MSSVRLSHDVPKSESKYPISANEYYILSHPFKSILSQDQSYEEFSSAFNPSDMTQSMSIQGHYSEVLDRLASSLDSPLDYSIEIFPSRVEYHNSGHDIFDPKRTNTQLSYRSTFQDKTIMSGSNDTLFEHSSNDPTKYDGKSINSIIKNSDYHMIKTFNSPFPRGKKDKNCINAKDKFVCPVNGCSKEFTRKANCRAHMETHNPNRQRPFVCSACDKSYLRSIDLIRHIETSHEMSQKHCCNNCGRTFTRKEGLKKHKDRANCLTFIC